MRLINTDTGFRAGTLFGVIMADSDPKTVDRFTRGLIADLSCYPGLIKGGPERLW